MLLNINNIHWKECFYTQMFNYYLQTYMLYFLYVYNCFTCSKYFHSILNSFISFVKRFCLCIFLERRMKGGRKGEKHQCVIASYAPCTGDLAHNAGMCPDWELNWRRWFVGRHSVHWATPTRAKFIYFNSLKLRPLLYCPKKLDMSH